MDLKEKFLETAKKHHGDRFDYSLSEYLGHNLNIVIKCKIHGEFVTTPRLHYYSENGGCRECYLDNHRLNKEEFILRANKIHGNKYDYSKTKYGKSNQEPILITCKKTWRFLSNCF